MQLKDNQPFLLGAFDALDWENTPVIRGHGHGRDETRTIRVLAAPEGLSRRPHRLS